MTLTREQLAQLAARELRNGTYVNLGIGIPTLVANYIPEGVEVVLQSENGLLGIGPFPLEGEEDADLINAGKQTITTLPGSSFFNSAESFAMIRGGHVALTLLGAIQVSEREDLANWIIPNKMIKSMDNAMDLVSNTKRIIVLMTHAARDDSSKVLHECDLPMTSLACMDHIITDLAIFDVASDRLILHEI